MTSFGCLGQKVGLSRSARCLFPAMAATAFLASPVSAEAFDWVKTNCTTPDQTMCVESLEVKANGDPDSSYANNADLKAIGKPYPSTYGDGFILELVRPESPWRNRVYSGPTECQSPPHALMFQSVIDGSEAYCRDLVAATLPVPPPAAPRQVESLEGKTVRVKLRLGAFVPRYSVITGSGRGDLPEASVPNRTWSVDSASGQSVMTVVLKPEFTDGLMVGSDWCSFSAGCGPGPANWRGIMVNAFFGESTTFPQPDLLRGMTVFTNAFRYDSLKVDTAKRSMSVQIAGPHLRMDGTLNTAFAGVFIPAALASSSYGFGIPSSDAKLAESLQTYRDGSAVDMSASIIRSPEGQPTGIYSEISGITFSAPTYEWRGPARAAAPGKPSAAFSLDRKKRVFSATIKPETGVSYSVSATQTGAKKPRVRSGKCAPVSKSRKVSCSVKLAKGKWLVTVLPTRDGVAGTVLKRAVSVR